MSIKPCITMYNIWSKYTLNYTGLNIDVASLWVELELVLTDLTVLNMQ